MIPRIIQSLVAIVLLIAVSLLTGCIYGDGGPGSFHSSGVRPHWEQR